MKLNEIFDPHLVIDPACLFCLMDYVAWSGSADEQRRFRIVQFHVPEHDCLFRIGIAVAAEMPAGIIGADIAGDIAGTFFAVAGVSV